MEKLSPVSLKGVAVGCGPAEGHRVPVSPAWKLLENHELETASGQDMPVGPLGLLMISCLFWLLGIFFGGLFFCLFVFSFFLQNHLQSCSNLCALQEPVLEQG